MKLTMFKEGSIVKVKSIDSDFSTRKRIKSFGINVGSQITIQHFSIGNNNVEIKTEGGLVALRESEANEILCEEVK